MGHTLTSRRAASSGVGAATGTAVGRYATKFSVVSARGAWVPERTGSGLSRDASANYAAWDPFLLLPDVRKTEFSSAH